MEARCVYDYKKAGSEAANYRPDIALAEIPEKNGYLAAETLEVCGEIKKASDGICDGRYKRRNESALPTFDHKKE